MVKIQKKDMWLFIAQVAVWTVVLFALPLATFLSTPPGHRSTLYGDCFKLRWLSISSISTCWAHTSSLSGAIGGSYSSTS